MAILMKAHSLLKFDMVNVDEGISSALREEIERDGMIFIIRYVGHVPLSSASA